MKNRGEIKGNCSVVCEDVKIAAATTPEAEALMADINSAISALECVRAAALLQSPPPTPISLSEPNTSCIKT